MLREGCQKLSFQKAGYLLCVVHAAELIMNKSFYITEVVDRALRERWVNEDLELTSDEAACKLLELLTRREFTHVSSCSEVSAKVVITKYVTQDGVSYALTRIGIKQMLWCPNSEDRGWIDEYKCFL